MLLINFHREIPDFEIQFTNINIVKNSLFKIIINILRSA